jgi:hypothetical protein
VKMYPIPSASSIFFNKVSVMFPLFEIPNFLSAQNKSQNYVYISNTRRAWRKASFFSFQSSDGRRLRSEAASPALVECVESKHTPAGATVSLLANWLPRRTYSDVPSNILHT